MTSHTKPGTWLQRHGWILEGKEPHGYAVTHLWRSPYDGKLYNQSYALFEQRNRNRNLSAANVARRTPTARIGDMEGFLA
jgi:hypothetical protein